MRTTVLLIVFLLGVCSSANAQRKVDPNTKKAKPVPEIEREKLYGIWAQNLNENANFAIGKDSMYYVDANKSVKYWIKQNYGRKDSIFIDYGGSVYRGIFYFRNDSLIIRDQRSEHKFVRIK